MNWNLDFFSMHSKWISLTSGVGSHGFTREMKPGFGIIFCQIIAYLMVRRIKLIVNKTLHSNILDLGEEALARILDNFAVGFVLICLQGLKDTY